MPLLDQHILAIDDTPSIRTFLRILLQAHGAHFHEAGTGAEGMYLNQTIAPDLIVLDLGLPDIDGLEILPLIKELRSDGSQAKIIILSVRKEQNVKDAAFALGADDYLTKPFLMEELIEVIERNLNHP